jgi:hypothetical protein
MKPADIATGVVVLWALAALTWQQPGPSPQPQRTVQAMPAQPLAGSNQLPDRRTLSQFPGP